MQARCTEDELQAKVCCRTMVESDHDGADMPCPICNDDAAERYRPFCSRRCADVDLGRWLTGGYAIPSDAPEDADASVNEDDDAGSRMH